MIERLTKSKSLLKLIKKDVMPHNYRAMLRQRMAQNTLTSPQMLQSISSIQNQLSKEMPERFEVLPDYFGPMCRPSHVPPPSLFEQHTERQKLEFHRMQNVVQFPPPQYKAITGPDPFLNADLQFKDFNFQSDLSLGCPFKESIQKIKEEEFDPIFRSFYTIQNSNLHKVTLHSQLLTPAIISLPTILM